MESGETPTYELLKCSSCGNEILGFDVLTAGNPPRCATCKFRKK